MTKAHLEVWRAPHVTRVEWEHWVEGEGEGWNWVMQLHGATQLLVSCPALPWQPAPEESFSSAIRKRNPTPTADPLLRCSGKQFLTIPSLFALNPPLPSPKAVVDKAGEHPAVGKNHHGPHLPT